MGFLLFSKLSFYPFSSSLVQIGFRSVLEATLVEATPPWLPPGPGVVAEGRTQSPRRLS